jgi:hypothetical protein
VAAAQVSAMARVFFISASWFFPSRKAATPLSRLRRNQIKTRPRDPLDLGIADT